MTAPQMSELFRDAPADTGPAVGCRRSSTIALEFGGAGTLSWMTYPVPAVYVRLLAVEMRPITRSPFEAVVADPLVGALLVPCEPAVTSSESTVATPEYSRMAKRSVPSD